MVKKITYERMSKGERKLALGLAYGMGKAKLEKMHEKQKLMDELDKIRGQSFDMICIDEAADMDLKILAHLENKKEVIATTMSGRVTPSINPLTSAQIQAQMQQLQDIWLQHVKGVFYGPGQTNQASHGGPTIRTNPEYWRAYQDLAPGVTAGEITGYRAWSFNPRESGCLKSITADKYWDYEKPMEGDVREWGIYSFKDPYMLMQAISPAYNGKRIIYGQIKMWGEVIEHEHGHRAQYARVHSLDYCKTSCFLKMARHNYKFIELTPEEKLELYRDVQNEYGGYNRFDREEE